jgi:PIN domain nuclease of toxin-antitoxin system
LSLLLDTHVWIWSQESPAELGPRASAALTDEAEQNGVSAISALEIARLVAGGVIGLSIPLSDWVRDSMAALAADSVPLTADIALEAYHLPEPFHKDPADRILVATARLRGLTLVTADERILRYESVQTFDARS